MTDAPAAGAWPAGPPPWAAGRGRPTVHVFGSADEASAAATTRIAEALIGAAAARGRADWATTGGSTPVPIYRRLALPPLRDEIPWDVVNVWWGDDRVVPADHPLSNRMPLDSVLVGTAALGGFSGYGEDAAQIHEGREPGVALAAQNIHPIPMALALEAGSPQAAAAAYEAELRGAPLSLDANGFPILDVVLVGVGPDGHVFSVFPGSPLLDGTAWVSPVVAPTHVEPHVERVSLHPAILAAARLPIAVVLGGGKAEMLAAVLGPERDVRRWPAQLAARTGAEWYLDEAAAARLPTSARAST
jgi:6-phosphogluconolactonase